MTVRNGKVETITKSTPGGLAIRFFSVDRVAFGHTTNVLDTAVDLLISKLTRLSRKTSKQQYATLPQPGNVSAELDIYAPSYTDISTDAKIDYLTDLEEIALQYDPLVKQSNGMTYRETISTVNLVNSNGINLTSERTIYNVGVNVTAQKGEEMYPGEGDFSARHFEDLPKPEKMVDIVAGRAVRMLGGTAVGPGEYEIIFSPAAAGSILWGLAFALNGDDFSKGSSFLSGKEGEKFADSKLTVIDDALMPKGVASRLFDDEGIPSQTNVLVENGVFNTALYDYQTALKYGKHSTGSAVRGGYSDFPDIRPSNFYIKAGEDKVEDVVSACKKGILVESTQGWGLHSVNGTYSAGINGTLIKNGQRIKPVANVTLAASNDELFNGIGAICDDITFYHRYSAPSIMIKKMHVGA